MLALDISVGAASPPVFTTASLTFPNNRAFSPSVGRVPRSSILTPPAPEDSTQNPLNRFNALAGISGRIMPLHYKAMSISVEPSTTLLLSLPFASPASATPPLHVSVLIAQWPRPSVSASSPSVLIMTPPSAAKSSSQHVMSILPPVNTLLPTVNSKMG
jgi:hypothetical protein